MLAGASTERGIGTERRRVRPGATATAGWSWTTRRACVADDSGERRTGAGRLDSDMTCWSSTTRRACPDYCHTNFSIASPRSGPHRRGSRRRRDARHPNADMGSRSSKHPWSGATGRLRTDVHEGAEHTDASATVEHVCDDAGGDDDSSARTRADALLQCYLLSGEADVERDDRSPRRRHPEPGRRARAPVRHTASPPLTLVVWARHQTRHRAATMQVAFRALSGFTCLNEDASTQARDIHSLLLAVHAPNRSLRVSRRSGLAALAAAMAGRAARGCGDMSGTALHASLTCVTLASSLRNSRC